MKTTYTIQLFAGLSERIGQPTITLSADNDQSLQVSALKQRIADLYPQHKEVIRVSFLACNQAYASDHDTVTPSDELALLPPVSGGEDTEVIHEGRSEDSRYLVTDAPLSVDEISSLVISPANGASLAFIGTTREWTQGKRTIRLEYEAYVPMAVRTLRQIGEEIDEKWPGTLCAIAHRIGVVELAEASVIIAVSAPHRDVCYEASRYAIERLKQIVPIWKKEIWEDGSEWKGHQLGPWNPVSSL
ncbi:molybdenum cofactor biosynthesis protein [Paenibacillus abyssi]|uniref:Molybdopterin synthase catalytic subunit n=1 Tax=Paenibacillus abyssi TaxID=1340531 RepID=A0A917G7B3_9BACL|nr:molybdenum cofactor biosynthesis protein MoaE [Paenibacillus abyssi]GGG26644.1 hypothetical protein GCM10010916_48810 [Paenibacillus abyssi]